MASDILRFFRAWVLDPLRVASITPSSAALASLMVSEISSQTGSVIELGPGTGVFTRALIRQGISEEKLFLVEKGEEFVVMLGQRFPQAHLLHIDAADIGGTINPDAELCGAVVSGLPLLSLSTKTVTAILAGSFAHLREDGCFYQFTYGPRCPIPNKVLQELGLRATRIGRTLRNIPPAAVYRIARQPIRLEASAARPVGTMSLLEKA
jgi:phosphatidylethanolamine/phosphatidyl-N-methylethanolamine N-methyltransferase